LAYELHLRCRGTQTVAIDIDPYLLVIAKHVVRGASVRLTEASVKVMDGADLSRTWSLSAASGPLQADAFQCLFADGTHPPFADASFDSVVTPWFIDQVPHDLPAFVSELGRLLRPGGIWLNHGPLIYPESIPFDRRYAQGELFELLAERGFSLLGSSRASERYLVSPLSGAGKVESVLSFLAERRRA
jgi:SAM-dependent methyltransferase